MVATLERTPGQRLRDLRVGKGWSQTKLAVKARVSIGTISFAEQDKRHPLELVQERIAKALGVERREIWPEVERKAS
jgi:transcriptional regulator with XRE-family HTH domain